MSAIAALLPTIEIVLLCLGGFIYWRRASTPYSTTAALALGILSGLGLLSFIFQCAFLAGFPAAAPVLEGGVIIGTIGFNWGHWHRVNDIWQAILRAFREAPGAMAILAVSLAYLFCQAYLLPPSSWDATIYHLPRVLLWEQNQSLFLRDFSIPQQAVFPVGSDILFHAFLRLQTDYGLGIFSWLSYVVILVGTYALVAPRTNRTVAFTTAIAIACLPEIVYQATATKNDIFLAAVALGCVILADQWLRSTSVESLLGLGLMLCFGVAVKTSFVLFAFFFGACWLSLVIQQKKLKALIYQPFTHWQAVLILTIPGLVLSQIWLFWDNYQQFGAWIAPTDFKFINQNNDGLWGGVANLTRYGLQSIHLMKPINDLWASIWGWSITDSLQAIYDSLFAPIFGQTGFAEIAKDLPFEIVWEPREYVSWFGPVSVFLIYPAVFGCLLKGRELPRLMAFTALGLVLMISYQIGWSPWKNRFFTLVFASTGLCVGWYLHWVQAKPRLLVCLRWVSLVILLYASLFNYAKPVFPSSFYLGRENIWVVSQWTRDRLVYDHLSRGEQVEHLSKALTAAHRVLVVGYDHYFSLMFQNPELEFVLLSTAETSEGEHSLREIQNRLPEVDHLVCLQKRCHIDDLDIDLDLLWNNNGQFDGIPEVYHISAS